MKIRSLFLCVLALLLCALLISCGKNGPEEERDLTDPTLETTAPATVPATTAETPTGTPQNENDTTVPSGSEENITTKPSGSSVEEPSADLATDVFK